MTTTLRRPNPASFFIRPATGRDVPSLGRIYVDSFLGPGANGDNLVEILFPSLIKDKTALASHVSNIFLHRLWQPLSYTTKVVDDGTGNVVGFTCVMEPKRNISFYRRWISPYTWFSYFGRQILRLRDALFQPVNPDEHILDTFGKVLTDVLVDVATTERRKNAWYISTIALQTDTQGLGLGRKLMDDCLKPVDNDGAAVYLVGLRGTNKFYSKFGFKLIAQANVREFAGWTEGGLIMIRE